MSTFVLVHGGFHGPWCWARVAPLLAAAGHDVRTPDLLSPDAGDQLADASGDVILVGHSSGGVIVTELARRPPYRVAALVYVSAFLLPPGAGPRTLGPDEESLMVPALAVDAQRGTVAVRPERAVELFYGECSPEDAAWAVERLRPEPLRTLGQVPSLDGQKSLTRQEPTPRYYVECLRDKALGPHMQQRMHSELPCRRVYPLPADHSPFLSMPGDLAGNLLDVAARQARGELSTGRAFYA